ncbi:MAG: response regulator transcription factor [Gammaproteobacteria bacterium]
MAPVSGSSAAAQQSTICVVESDPREREALSQLLSHLQHAVSAFDSAEALLATMDDLSVAMIVASLELPGMSGLELLQALRARGCRAPTIMLAGEPDVATAVGAIRAGAMDFIQKPVIDRVLLRRVRDALEHPGA